MTVGYVSGDEVEASVVDVLIAEEARQRKEIEHLRKALQEISDEYPQADHDAGRIARAALNVEVRDDD